MMKRQKESQEAKFKKGKCKLGEARMKKQQQKRP